MSKQTITIKGAYELITDCAESIDTAHHAVKLHMLQSDAMLRDRIHVEKLTGCSCFLTNNLLEVVELIQDVIYESKDIVKYVMNMDIKDDIRIVANYPGIGKKFLSSKQEVAIPCDSVVVIISKEFDEYGFLHKLYVKTCYPF